MEVITYRHFKTLKTEYITQFLILLLLSPKNNVHEMSNYDFLSENIFHNIVTKVSLD